VATTDLKISAQKQEIYLEAQTGTIMGTIQDINEKRANQHVG
jgi:hypothetical protein